MENPNPNPIPGTEQAPVENQQQQPNAFDELRTKKGFKDNDSFAKSYTEMESTHGRTQNAFNSAKQQVETNSQGAYTLDEKGTISLTDKGQQMQYQQQQLGNYQQQQPGQYAQPAAEPIYDPYTNQPITDPVAAQLARMPLGQREVTIFTAMAEQREKQNQASYANETEMLNSPEAKGFEGDVKKVMMQLPLAHRANKQVWQQTLLQVKGAKYDDAMKNANQQGVDNFLNKTSNQSLPQASASSASSGSSLSPAMEQQYQLYQRNQPGTFKNREEFAKYSNPTASR